MHYGQAEAGEGGIVYQDRTRHEAEYRAPQDVLERVLIDNTPLPSAPHLTGTANKCQNFMSIASIRLSLPETHRDQWVQILKWSLISGQP